MAGALQLVNLTKTFGSKRAVDAINLEIPQGMLYAFLGPNGAGKSTTLKMVAGLLKPDAGDALNLGHSIQNDPKAAKQQLAYSPDWHYQPGAHHRRRYPARTANPERRPGRHP